MFLVPALENAEPDRMNYMWNKSRNIRVILGRGPTDPLPGKRRVKKVLVNTGLMRFKIFTYLPQMLELL